MIGQINLINKLNKYNIDTFPRTTLLIGDKGSGKHLICDYISKNILKLPLYELKDLSNELITEINLSSNPYIYIIDCNTLSEKQQNIILKFIEEPLKNAFIILLCTNKNILLPTIVNRCISLEIEPYSKEELSTFVRKEYLNDIDLILSVYDTPGKIIDNLDHSNYKSLYELCLKMCDKLNIASYTNTLSIADKINYKDEYDKYDIDSFIKMLEECLFNKYLKEGKKIFFKLYSICSEYSSRINIKILNKKYIIEQLLTQLWMEVRNDAKTDRY